MFVNIKYVIYQIYNRSIGADYICSDLLFINTLFPLNLVTASSPIFSSSPKNFTAPSWWLLV